MPAARAHQGALVPIALGAGALLWLHHKGGGPLAGSIPAGGPYAALTFEGHNSLGVSGEDIARAARELTAGQRYQGGVPWVVVDAATDATGGGEGSKMYATVLVRVGEWMAGKAWDTVLAPLRQGGGGTFLMDPVRLVDARSSGPTLDLSEQTALGTAPGNQGLLDKLKSWLNTATGLIKWAAVALLAVAGWLVYREVRPLIAGAGTAVRALGAVSSARRVHANPRRRRRRH